jgi:hypothetical protein
MHAVLASCIVSCATTIFVNVLLARQHRRRAQPARDREQDEPSARAARDSGADDIHAGSGHDQDVKEHADRQQSARLQADDEFAFTPHKAKPPRTGEHLLPPGMAPYALQSPINATKRADPYDPAPRSW